MSEPADKADSAADQVTQDAVALLLALLNEDAAAFNTVLDAYQSRADFHELAVTLAAVGLQLGQEDKRTAEDLRGNLSGLAIDVGTLRDGIARREDEEPPEDLPL